VLAVGDRRWPVHQFREDADVRVSGARRLARCLAHRRAGKTRARYHEGVASGLAKELTERTQVAKILASEAIRDVIRAESGTRCGTASGTSRE
jgi:hypothetical protein